MDSSQCTSSYCPDFSDICSEDSTFWDFLKTNENTKDVSVEKQNSKDNFWDFLESSNPINTSLEEKEEMKLKVYENHTIQRLLEANSNLKMLVEKSEKLVNEQNKTSSCNSIYLNTGTYTEDVSSENEDEFWDFLKSDNFTWKNEKSEGSRSIYYAELEQIRKNSSVTSHSKDNSFTASATEFLKSSTRVTDSKSSHKSSDILLHNSDNTSRDMDEILFEINPTLQKLEKRALKDPQEAIFEQIFNINNLENKKPPLNIVTHSGENFGALNESYADNLESESRHLEVNTHRIKNIKSSISDKTNSEERSTKFESKNEAVNLQCKTFIQKKVTNAKQCIDSSTVEINSLAEPNERNSLNSTKKIVRYDSNLITVAENSKVLSSDLHLQNKPSNKKNVSFTEYETQTFDQPNSDQLGVFPSNLQSEKGVKSSINLPVISSVYSMSTCSKILNQNEISPRKQSALEQDKNNLKENILIDTNCHTCIPPLNTDSFLSSSNLLSKQNVTCSSNSIETRAVSNTFSNAPRKQKNVKRLLPQSSPKNSIFRITDCDSGGSTQQFAKVLGIKATEQKRQKTSDSAVKLNNVNPDTSNSKSNLQYQTQGPIKNVGIFPESNTAISNPVSLYLIIPKNTESSQNAEFVMLVNNNTTTSNTIVKNVPNLVSPIPVLPVTCVQNISAQIPETIQPINSNQQIPVSKFQQVSMSAANLMPLKDNKQMPNVTSCLQPTLICQPVYQRVGNESANAKIVINATSINTIPPNSLTQNIYSTTVGSTNVMPHISFANAPCLTNNFQFPNTITKVNRPSIEGNVGLVSNVSNQIQQPSQIIHTLPYNSIPQKRIKISNPEKSTPIKNIALGKDKNAIQQTSFPLKMENVLGPNICCGYDNLVNCGSSYPLIESVTNFIATDVNKNIVSQESKHPIKQQSLSKLNVDFIPYKPKTGSVLIKRDLITNSTEMMNKNQFFKVHNSQLPVLKSVNSLQNSELSGIIPGNEIKNLLNSNQRKQITHLETNIKKKDSCCKEQCKSQESYNSEVPKSFNEIFKSEPITVSTNTGQQKSALATLQAIFPPPISMIPVCVIQTAPTAIKPTISKVLVLQDTNPALTFNNQTIKPSNSYVSRKTCTKKTTMKIKKMGRKTVRELLQDRRQNVEADSQYKVYQPPTEMKILKPIMKLSDNRLVRPTLAINKQLEIVNESLQDACRNTNVSINTSKRPNIMILPSASKAIQENPPKEIGCNQQDNSENSKLQDKSLIFEVPKDLLSFNSPEMESTAVSKDYRPKHYDMCGLSIGYFKVDDDLDDCGRFRSKFKVLFTKRQFLYDFPVVNCNQVDLNSVHVWDQMARILVPFKTISAINMFNKRITIQVNSCPQIYLWKSVSRFGSISNAKGPNKVEDNNMWIDAMHNSFIHKITLRKRQADSLKVLLCQFEPKFLMLFSVNINGNSNTDATPYEEELTAINLRKAQPKNKKNVIRRLPRWDSEYAYEPPVLLEEDPLFASNHVCSCRISCRSLRCSCVKAAKSCSTVGTICSCTSCDNPLNVLESFGLHLDFSLSDCCLFQNIYQIPRLRNYLEREVKLSCCNTIARILDCIPGTILCPNTECNASLEFSWCRGIICYPERNPRNHCSFCGQCCFSNGRHCPVCNRCYIVKPRSLNCPTCGANGVSETPLLREVGQRNGFYKESPFEGKVSVKKPEIILLDKSSDANANFLVEKEEIGVAEITLENNSSLTLENGISAKNETGLIKLDTYDEKKIEVKISPKKTEDCSKINENFQQQDGIKNTINLTSDMKEDDLKVEHTLNEIFESPLRKEKKPSEDFSPGKYNAGISFCKINEPYALPFQQIEIKQENSIKLEKHEDSELEIILEC